MIEKLRLKQFCCCCTIRTGSLVIGIFGWMLSLMQAMTLTTPTDKVEITEVDNNIVFEKQSGLNIAAILLSIFMFAVSVSLVIGVYKNNRLFILPWLIIKFLECCAVTIATVVLFFMMFVMEQVGIIILMFIILGLLSALCWYCWLCVWSLNMDMSETTLTYIPTGYSIPMTEPPMQQHPQYPMENKPTSPPQEMV